MFAATITLTIAPSTTRVMNRTGDGDKYSTYEYSDANESIIMKIRHSADPKDADGLIMRRHNVYLERVVYATPSSTLKKFTSTCTFRCSEGADPAASATLTTGMNAWIASSTIAADLSVGII